MAEGVSSVFLYQLHAPVIPGETEFPQGFNVFTGQCGFFIDSFHGDSLFGMEFPGEEHFEKGEILGKVWVIGGNEKLQGVAVPAGDQDEASALIDQMGGGETTGQGL